MEELNAFQKLDLVLSVLEYHSMSLNEIQDKLKLERNTFQEIRQIVSKLIKDDYAEELKVKQPYNGPSGFESPDGTYWISYKITFEGELLRQSGGYVQKEAIAAYENTRLEEIERKATANQRFLTWLTVIVAVGTLAQALYSLTKLYWEHGWFH